MRISEKWACLLINMRYSQQFQDRWQPIMNILVMSSKILYLCFLWRIMSGAMLAAWRSVPPSLWLLAVGEPYAQSILPTASNGLAANTYFPSRRGTDEQEAVGQERGKSCLKRAGLDLTLASQ